MLKFTGGLEEGGHVKSFEVRLYCAELFSTFHELKLTGATYMRRTGVFISIDWTCIFIFYCKLGVVAADFLEFFHACRTHCIWGHVPLTSEWEYFSTDTLMPYPSTVGFTEMGGCSLSQVKLWPRGCWQDSVDKSICSPAPPWQLEPGGGHLYRRNVSL